MKKIKASLNRYLKYVNRATLEPNRSPGSIITDLPNGQLVKEISTCDGFAVDWVNDRVYWADCGRDGTSIMSMGLAGDAEQTVLYKAELANKVIKRMEIDPYKG